MGAWPGALEHLNLKPLGRLLEAAVVTGEESALFGHDLRDVGRGELHAVVAPKGEGGGQGPGCFHHLLAALDDREAWLGADQVLLTVASGFGFRFVAGRSGQFAGYVGEESSVEGCWVEEEKRSSSKRAILALLSLICSIS